MCGYYFPVQQRCSGTCRLVHVYNRVSILTNFYHNIIIIMCITYPVYNRSTLQLHHTSRTFHTDYCACGTGFDMFHVLVALTRHHSYESSVQSAAAASPVAYTHRVNLHRAEHNLRVVSRGLSTRGTVVVPQGQLVDLRGLGVEGASLASQILAGTADPYVLGLHLRPLR